MFDSIYDLLASHFDSDSPSFHLDAQDPTTSSYINRLTTLSLPDLSTTENASLTQSSTSNLRSIQALSKRSHKSVVSAAQSLSSVSSSLPSLSKEAADVKDALPSVESKASAFAEKYRKSNETTNPVLIQRRNALLLARNADRISSILDLPTLLSSAISSGQTPSATSTSASTGPTGIFSGSAAVNYASALDLYAHVKRLTGMYPDSPLVSSIGVQSEQEMHVLTSNLITSLRSQGIKLASAMRTIGWLRRVAPELDDQLRSQGPGVRRGRAVALGAGGSGDGAIGALFLVCRLASLDAMLEALEPLRELADQETSRRIAASKEKVEAKGNKRRESNARNAGSSGQQTERYLKRYIEIFREQSFAIVSMYKSIFPGALPTPGSHELQSTKAMGKFGEVTDALLPLPSPLATFPAHLVDRLFDILRTYLPNVRDSGARDSLMTQVLYCAGSLGRLGGDFSMMLALLEEEIADELFEPEQIRSFEMEDEEWVKVMKKHRVQASRLELLASGVGTGKNATKKANVA